MTQDSLLAAVVQLNAGTNVQQNISRASNWAKAASKKGAQLIVFPENFAFMGPPGQAQTLAESLAVPFDGPILQQFSELAKTTNAFVVLGGMPTVSATPGRPYNSLVLLSPQGTISATYHKRHLFDVQLSDGNDFNESSHCTAGTDPIVASLLGTKLGLSICYDLRFPEHYRALVDQGARLFCVPSAFTLHTGKDHWFALLRARAIENQCYVLAAAQIGRTEDGDRWTYGKSCIIDPWGDVIAQVSDKEGIAMAELDLHYIEEIRRRIPCLLHRRL